MLVAPVIYLQQDGRSGFIVGSDACSPWSQTASAGTALVRQKFSRHMCSEMTRVSSELDHVVDGRLLDS